MVELVRIKREDRPSPFTNHVILEDTRGGPIRVVGASNRDGAVVYLAPPLFHGMQDALKAASNWAEDQGINTVHLILEWNEWQIAPT